MLLENRIVEEVKSRLLRDYAMRDAGQWLRGGKCPKCGKKELFARADNPRMIICGRKEKCGHEQPVRELYPEIFDNWSERTRDDPSPTAAADAYMLHVRGFDLQHLRGAYAQELYRDRDSGLTSATVRFPLPNGSWWERLIDQPERFSKKANFAPKSSYQGYVWTMPGVAIADYAAADEIWMTEGIFNSVALDQGDFRAARDPEHPVHKAPVLVEPDPTFDFVKPVEQPEAAGAPVENLLTVSLMSCYNYPEHFLRELRIAIAGGANPTKSPRLVFALDNGAAGSEYTRRFVDRARKEGWTADAAQGRLEEEPGADLDWNDLFLRGRLGHKHRQDYLWAGSVLVAEDEREKAFLIWQRRGLGSFYFTFEGRTWWARFPSEAAIAAEIKEGFEDDPILSVADLSVKRVAVARRMMSVEQIANCTFRALYFERNEQTDTSAYWLRVDRPGQYEKVKASFPGNALAGPGEFKKRLLSVASGAIWTGEAYQLDRILQRQLPVRDVTGIEFTGYCREHKAYVFGDLAVAGGKVYRPNDDGYFDIGRAAIKLRTSERILDAITYDPDRIDTSWLPDLWTAFGAKGLVYFAFMNGLVLVAEQIRAQPPKGLGFLEVTGVGGSGKTTLTEFLWKLLGRGNYEGFDPAKATQAGIARELAKVGNLPVAFIEGDRKDDVPHHKKFDWEETKTLYQGRATRTRGVQNAGLETYSPPFRGGFLIVQNDPVDASRPVLERIMSVHFDKTGWTDATKAAANRLKAWPIEDISGYIVHFCRREPELLERYFKRYAHHEAALLALDGVTDSRLAENHAQLLAMLDALPIVLPDLREEWLEAARGLVRIMAIDRHRAVATDHPHVETFWDRFDFLEERASQGFSLNHARDSDLIAVRLVEFEERIASNRMTMHCPISELRKLLKSSKRHPFVEAKPVNSRNDLNGARTVHCWVFQRHPTTKA